MKKSELRLLCEHMEQGCTNKICKCNEIVCVKKELQQCVGEDKNKYLKIKAQIKQFDKNEGAIFELIAKYVAIGAFILGVIYNVCGKDSVNYIGFAFVLLLILFVICVLNVCSSIGNLKINKWIRYIDVALDDMAKERKWI